MIFCPCWVVCQGPGEVGVQGGELRFCGGVTGVAYVTGVAQAAEMGVLHARHLSKDHTRRCHLR